MDQVMAIARSYADFLDGQGGDPRALAASARRLRDALPEGQRQAAQLLAEIEASCLILADDPEARSTVLAHLGLRLRLSELGVLG